MADVERSACALEAAPERWVLDRKGFEALLRFLDPDRERAAIRYEEIRRRLVKLFTWRGCLAPDEYVDRTMDRVARRLAEGADIQVRDPYQYVHGVAQNVLREHWREPGRRLELINPAADLMSQPAEAQDQEEEDRDQLERTLACLDTCLARLPARTRALLLSYHAEPDRIARRQRLAASLGIPLNALRIRVHRIRAAVERSVVQCVEGRRAETNPLTPHYPSSASGRHDRPDRRSTRAVSPGTPADRRT